MNQNFVRQSNIELLRIVVMLMIIGCHFCTHGGFQFENSDFSIPRLWWNLLEMGGNFGVVVFVLISGYFLIDDKELTIKPTKTIKLYGQILFYSITFWGLSLILGKDTLSLKSISTSIFPIASGQWWFARITYNKFRKN